MDEDHLRKIEHAIDSLPDNFSILEEQIDVKLQMKYFKYVKDKRNNEPIEDFSLVEQQLDSPEQTPEQKRILLVRLAGSDKVDAFRVIERFQKKSRGNLRKWATLALQESRMVLHSFLLGEQQIFISTGLGGKGQNIRYFIAMIKKDRTEFSETQQKIVKSEFGYFLNDNNGELENIKFENEFALGLFLFPLKKSLNGIFHSFIDECNQYGNFLHENVIITNVKILTIDEVKNFIYNGKQSLI